MVFIKTGHILNTSHIEFERNKNFFSKIIPSKASV